MVYSLKYRYRECLSFDIYKLGRSRCIYLHHKELKEMNASKLLKDHMGIINKTSRYYSNKFSRDFEDVRQDALVIFTRAASNFDPEKNVKFSTFLVTYLRELSHEDKQRYGTKEMCWKPQSFSSSCVDSFVEDVCLRDSIERDLSEDAQKVIQFLFTSKRRVLSKSSTLEHLKNTYGWAKKRRLNAWETCQNWWKTYKKSDCDLYNTNVA